MNVSRLMSWLRRRAGWRENQPAARRQCTIHAPELLEPRTVLSAMPLFGAGADDGAPDRSAGFGETPYDSVRVNLAAYVAHAGDEERSFDREVLSSPAFGGPVLESQTSPLLDAPQQQQTFGPAKLTIETQLVPLTPEWSLLVTTAYVSAPLGFGFRTLALSSASSASASAAPLSGLASPPAAGSADDDAEGEASRGEYSRTFVAATPPSLPPALPILILGGYGAGMGMPAASSDRLSLGNSAASESHEPAPTYDRTIANGSLLADELTTHLMHAEEDHSTRASTSLIASPLTATSTAGTVAARRATDDADARLTDPWLAGERDDQRGDGASDGMIALDDVGAIRRGRKPAAAAAKAAASVNPRLARLADLALLHDGPTFVRELARIAHDALSVADESAPALSPEYAENRMLDLLAADVSTLRQSAAAVTSPTATIAPAASQPLLLEAGVVLYQAFDLASEGAQEGAATNGQQVVSTAAAETAARTEE